MLRKAGRKIIEAVIGRFGYELTPAVWGKGVFARTTMKGALDFLVKKGSELGFEPRTVIDVGVADGTEELYRAYPKAKILLVDPMREFEDVMKEICTRYDAVYELVAADTVNGVTTINTSPDLSGSSIMEMHGPIPGVETREIPTRRLDDLVREHGLKPPFVLKVDAQAAELRVLEGAVETLSQTEIMILEVPFFSSVKNGPQFYDIIRYTYDKGFAAYDIVDKAYRMLDRALAEVNAVFVKRDGIFRKVHDWASHEQRLELSKQSRRK